MDYKNGLYFNDIILAPRKAKALCPVTSLHLGNASSLFCLICKYLKYDRTFLSRFRSCKRSSGLIEVFFVILYLIHIIF